MSQQERGHTEAQHIFQMKKQIIRYRQKDETRGFLKSFSSVQTSPKEDHIINNLNRLFSTLTAMTILMMITNSVFSLLSPYFWIGDVFASNKKISLAFLISTMLFYITNCAFALLLLYLHYKLQTNVQNEETLQNSS